MKRVSDASGFIVFQTAFLMKVTIEGKQAPLVTGNLKPHISTIKRSLNSVIENGVMGWITLFRACCTYRFVILNVVLQTQ